MIELIPTVWLERCLEIMDTDPETASASVGLPAGIYRPELGPAVRDLTCNVCGAGWAGIIGDPCWWCQRGREIQLDHQADLLLHAPDVDQDDDLYQSRMKGWADRMIIGVTAGIITARQAETAWTRNVKAVA